MPNPKTKVWDWAWGKCEPRSCPALLPPSRQRRRAGWKYFWRSHFGRWYFGLVYFEMLHRATSLPLKGLASPFMDKESISKISQLFSALSREEEVIIQMF